MTPFELAVLALFSLIMVGDVGREHQLHRERWWVGTMLFLIALAIVSILWTVKGML